MHTHHHNLAVEPGEGHHKVVAGSLREAYQLICYLDDRVQTHVLAEERHKHYSLDSEVGMPFCVELPNLLPR